MPGIILSSEPSGPILPLLHLLEEVVERELLLADLLLESLRAALVDLTLGLLDQGHHVAHAEDALGHAVGVEALEVTELLPVDAYRIGLPVTALTDSGAARVAVEFREDDPVEVRRLGELLGHVDGVLTGHRVLTSRTSCGFTRS